MKCKYYHIIIILTFLIAFNVGTEAKVGFHSLDIPQKAEFIENKGQWDAEVLFLAKIEGVAAWIYKSGVKYDFHIFETSKNTSKTTNELYSADYLRVGHIVDLSYSGTNSNQYQINKVNAGSNKYNFLIGEANNWVSNVDTYSEIIIKSIYPGIDIRYYFEKIDNINGLRYDFIVSPCADVSNIRLNFDLGTDRNYSAFINNNNEIVMRTSLADIKHSGLYSYQVASYSDAVKDKIKQNSINSDEVNCRFVENSDGSFGFEVHNWDNSKYLVIDPIVFSTYIGTDGVERAMSIAVDSSGNSYIAGYTYSSLFPITAGAYQSNLAGFSDAVIFKIDSSGSDIIFSTYLGGTDNDFANSILIDSDNNIYVTGWTLSTNFPTTTSAYRRLNAGGQDAFLTKLNSYGTALIYSTYFGGSGYDYGVDIEIDNLNRVYLGGYTTSSNIPVTAGVIQTSNPGTQSGFVVKFNDSASALVFSTYLGGSNYDNIAAIALDESLNIFVGGSTLSANFPVTTNAYQTNYAGNRDGFISKLNANATSLLFSSFVGGSEADDINSVDVDTEKCLYVAGTTSSTDLTVTTGAIQSTMMGNRDVFVAKFDSLGQNLIYSTYLGGNALEYPAKILVDDNACAYITGTTGSNNFPTSQDALQATRGGSNDGFLTKINQTGTQILYSTFLGGSLNDFSNSLAIDNYGYVYLTGYTLSTNFPITAGSYQTTSSGRDEMFISKISGLNSEAPTIITEDLSQLIYCVGDSVLVPFTISGEFSENNTFIAQLSDATGAFSNPINIGSFQGIESDTIRGFIPMNFDISDNYKIRVIGTSPYTIGAANTNYYSVSKCEIKLIQVKIYMQGLWDGSFHKPGFVGVELRTGNNLFQSLLVGRKPAEISSDGYTVVNFGELPSGDYWLIVRASGYLPIASSQKITLSPFVQLNYDFTNNPEIVAGSVSNLVQVPNSTKWMLRVGDLDNDRRVNAFDLMNLLQPNIGKDLRYVIPTP